METKPIQSNESEAEEQPKPSRRWNDLHPKVAAGGLVGLIAWVVIQLIQQYYPGIPVTEEAAIAIATAVIFLAQFAGNYMKAE